MNYTWHRSVVITTAQLHATKSKLRFYAGSNPAQGVREICNGENLTVNLALQNLHKDKNIVFQKSDKRNSVAIANLTRSNIRF